jgi:hypothetical protein
MLTAGDLLPNSLFVGINTATIPVFPVPNLVRNVAVPERVNCAVPNNPSPGRQVERVASQKLTKPLLTIHESVTAAVRVTMAPAGTGSLGDTASIVLVGEMTAAFKFIEAVARIRQPNKNFTTGGETYLPPLGIEFDAIDGSDKREAIV